ncbi:AP-1-like transcription factor YAP2 [Nakaseomyces bracarensis]|uniref:AP-1-like transcription factor YAP2 n=1 Tax=Nakaseomyces bracarensis TaxID=273131 RepID=A0ABR4NU61_9SACH
MNKVKKEKKRAGRKVTDTEAKNKRTAQNRAAQRAFRERKEAKMRALEETIAVLKGMNSKKNGETEYLKRCLVGMIQEVTKYRPLNSGDQNMLRFLEDLRPDDVDSLVAETEATTSSTSGVTNGVTNDINIGGTSATANNGVSMDNSNNDNDVRINSGLSSSPDGSATSSSGLTTKTASTSTTTVSSNSSSGCNKTPEAKDNTNYDIVPEVPNGSSPLSVSFHSPLSTEAAKRGNKEQLTQGPADSSSWMDPIFDQELKLNPLTGDSGANPFDLFDMMNSPVITNCWTTNDLPVKPGGVLNLDFTVSDNNFITPDLVSYPIIGEDGDSENRVQRIEPKLAFPNDEVDKDHMLARRDSNLFDGKVHICNPTIESPNAFIEDNTSDLINDFTCSCQTNQTSCPTKQFDTEATPCYTSEETSDGSDEEVRCELLTRYILHKEPLSSILQHLRKNKESSYGELLSHGARRCTDICGDLVPKTGLSADDLENLCDELMNKAKISTDGGIIPKPQIMIKARDLQRTVAKHSTS